jgi:hypothetical protein
MLLAITIFSVAQTPSTTAPASTPKHFDHVLLVVLENQNYSAIRKDHVLPHRREAWHRRRA